MIAGDADGDGEISAADGSICTKPAWTDGPTAGADFNLDGGGKRRPI